MDIFTSMQIGATALKANRIRLNTISSNIANVETTSTPEGGPYKRKSAYFQSTPMSFKKHLDNELKSSIQGVNVTKIVEDNGPPKLKYDPHHPDANDDGYVALPNIDVLKEMVDMMSATRSYEANVTVIQSSKRMALKALELGR